MGYQWMRDPATTSVEDALMDGDYCILQVEEEEQVQDHFLSDSVNSP